eukprot:TRINITY_DN10374_c0_g1_i1.p1 TRINITY_DN10374_c0_g1~~TRINITY_DN10374_c0_g1_i1.p1  ORF type:complete len:328 (-),score=60.67 TRINITY_DN10374_c0_g1_i1:47-1030(-)
MDQTREDIRAELLEKSEDTQQKIQKYQQMKKIDQNIQSYVEDMWEIFGTSIILLAATYYHRSKRKEVISRVNDIIRFCEDFSVSVDEDSKSLLALLFISFGFLDKEKRIQVLKEIINKTGYIVEEVYSAIEQNFRELNPVQEESQELLEVASSQRYNYVVLILDRHFTNFPMEAFPILSSVPTTRIDSLRYLKKTLTDNEMDEKQKLYIKTSKVSYVLNPEGDLTRSEDQLRNLLEKQDARGIHGSIPTTKQYLKSLESSELFIYYGHNGGEKYCKRDEIIKIEEKCPVSLLFGCSSAYLKSYGDFDCAGLLQSYLLTGRFFLRLSN